MNGALRITHQHRRGCVLIMQAYVKQLTKAAASADGGNADGGRAAALGQVAMHCMQVGVVRIRADNVAVHAPP